MLQATLLPAPNQDLPRARICREHAVKRQRKHVITRVQIVSKAQIILHAQEWTHAMIVDVRHCVQHDARHNLVTHTSHAHAQASNTELSLGEEPVPGHPEKLSR